MKSDIAASDLIAVMALIAVFVTAMAILGVTLLATPPGDAAPAMLARSVTEDGRLSIHHDGGDPLEWEHVAILIDGVDRTADFSLVDASGGEHDTWTSWETGQVLVLSGVPEDAHIQIVGEGVSRTGSDWLLHEVGSGSAVGPTATATTVPTVTPTTIPTTIPTTEPTQVPLVAGFTADPISGSAPLLVQFTDTSAGGATSWSWDFGDGGMSTARNPAHTYANEGVYTVKLTIKNAKETDTVTKAAYIIVTEEHVSRLEVNSFRQVLIFTWWNVPVNGVSIDYSGVSGTGSDETPFALSKAASGDSGFSATLTAPDKIRIWILILPINMEFDGWQVGDTWYDSRTINVPIAEDESRTATAYYKF